MRSKTLDLLDAHFTSERKIYNSLSLNHKFASSEEIFVVNPSYWDKHYEEIKHVKFLWQEVKYDSKPDISKIISSNDPGVYMFYIRPNVCIWDLPKFVLYIGIAGATQALNPLKKDCQTILTKEI